MAWRVARSLETLLKQVNAACPLRDKKNDGTIGDENHQSRESDHNPWVDGGVVTALDITHDPRMGVDCEKIAEQLRSGQDRRIKYIIWNGQIANYQPLQGRAAFAWRPYHGASKHDKHMHLSVRPNSTLYDDASPWLLPTALPEPPPAVVARLKEIASPSLQAKSPRAR